MRMQPTEVDAFNPNSRGDEVATNIGDLQYQIAESIAPQVESIYGSMSGMASNIFQLRTMMEGIYHATLWMLFCLIFAFGWHFFRSMVDRTRGDDHYDVRN